MATEGITYDVTKFNPHPGSEVLCAICHCVLYQPRMCTCRHIFCRVCIETWLNRSSTCPTCRSHCTMRQLQLAPPLVQSLLNSLTMDCEYKENGCTYLVPMENFPSHIAQCDYKAAYCPNVGCKKETTVRDLAKHKEECLYRIEHCRKDCGLPVPFNKLENHVCVTALRERVTELNGILHKHQVVLKWMRSKLNIMYVPQQAPAIQLQAFHDTLNDINHYWPPDQPIPLRFCGNYIAAGTSATATSTSQTSAAEPSQEAGQSGNSILERLVSEASNPQEQQRRRRFTSRYPDEVDRWDYPPRGHTWRTLDRYPVERRTSPPQSPSPPLLRDDFPPHPRYIPLENYRGLLPPVPNPSNRPSQNATVEPPQAQRASPGLQRDSPPRLGGHARSSRDRSPTPFPDVFRSENGDSRSYQSADTTDDDFSSFSDDDDDDSFSPHTPRSPSPADRDYDGDRRRDDYDMYWSYRHRRTTESADYSPQYSPARDHNRRRSRSYSRSRSPSHNRRSRSRSNFDRSRSRNRYSRSRSRGYSRSWSRDSMPRRYSRSRSHSRSRSRSRSDRRPDQRDLTHFTRSRSRSRSHSTPRRSGRSRSRSQSWNRREARNDDGSYHSEDQDNQYSDEGGYRRNEGRRLPEERGDWTPDSNHTDESQDGGDDDDDDDDDNDRHRSWLSSTHSQSQQTGDATDASCLSPEGSYERRRQSDHSNGPRSPHNSQTHSRRWAPRGRDRDSLSDSDSWSSTHTPQARQSPEQGNETRDEDRTWSTTADEHSDHESTQWCTSGTDAEDGERRSSPHGEDQNNEGTPTQENTGVHSGSEAEPSDGNRPYLSSPVQAAFSPQVSPSSESSSSSSSSSSRASAWHARSASSSRRARQGKEKSAGSREGTSAQLPSGSSVALNDSSMKNASSSKQGYGDTEGGQTGGRAASEGERNKSDQEAARNVWEISSDTTSLDYDEPSPTANSRADSSTAGDGLSTSHDSSSPRKKKVNGSVDKNNTNCMVGGGSAGQGTEENSSASHKTRSEEHGNGARTTDQASTSQAQSSRLQSDSDDQEHHGNASHGKGRRGGKGKGKALLSSKRKTDPEHSDKSDGNRHSDSDSNFKWKASLRHRPVLSSSDESSDADHSGVSGLPARGKASGIPADTTGQLSTGSTTTAQPVSSTSKEKSDHKKSTKSVNKNSPQRTDQTGNRDSSEQEKHSRKRKAEDSKQSRPAKKTKHDGRTADGENSGENLRSLGDLGDPRPSTLSTSQPNSRQAQTSHPVLSQRAQSVGGSATQVQTRTETTSADSTGLENESSVGRSARISSRGRRSTYMARERDGDDSNRSARPSVTTERRDETPASDRHNETRSSDRHRDARGAGRQGEIRNTEEGPRHTRIMRVESSERTGARAPRPIMRVENPAGRYRTNERRGAGDGSLRMVRIPDLPVPPSTLELLNQYAYSDESDSTWSPTSSDEENDGDYVYDQHC